MHVKFTYTCEPPFPAALNVPIYLDGTSPMVRWSFLDCHGQLTSYGERIAIWNGLNGRPSSYCSLQWLAPSASQALSHGNPFLYPNLALLRVFIPDLYELYATVL
jgi:hypothetical protein